MIVFRHWCWSFLGVVIESIPFIVMGAIISTIIEQNIPPNTLIITMVRLASNA